MSEHGNWDSDDALPQSERLQILSPEEYELLWGFPRFESTDRVGYFALNEREKAVLGRLRTPRTKAHFLLQLGYFRSRQRFVTLVLDDVAADLQYVCQQYLQGAALKNLSVLLKHTRQQHVNWISELFGFRILDVTTRVDLESRALYAARIVSWPLYVLRDLVDYLRRQRIE